MYNLTFIKNIRNLIFNVLKCYRILENPVSNIKNIDTRMGMLKYVGAAILLSQMWINLYTTGASCKCLI